MAATGQRRHEKTECLADKEPTLKGTGRKLPKVQTHGEMLGRQRVHFVTALHAERPDAARLSRASVTLVQ